MAQFGLLRVGVVFVIEQAIRRRRRRGRKMNIDCFCESQAVQR